MSHIVKIRTEIRDRQAHVRVQLVDFALAFLPTGGDRHQCPAYLQAAQREGEVGLLELRAEKNDVRHVRHDSGKVSREGEQARLKGCHAPVGSEELRPPVESRPEA